MYGFPFPNETIKKKTIKCILKINQLSYNVFRNNYNKTNFSVFLKYYLILKNNNGLKKLFYIPSLKEIEKCLYLSVKYCRLQNV